MPNIFGLYTKAEMRDRIRRMLDALRPEMNPDTGDEFDVDPITGAHLPLPQAKDPLFTNQDLDFYLNSAITAVWCDVVMQSDTVWADESLIDVRKNIIEYSLPEDMAQLRGLWWKDPSTRLMVIPPTDRVYMFQWDEGTASMSEIQNGAPTFRRNLNFIVLNDVPIQDNDGGILCRYIKMRNFLENDDSYLETEYAPILQEVVMRAAAIEANEEKAMLDVTPIKASLQRWEQRLVTAVGNAMNPPFIQMVSEQPRPALRVVR